MSVKQVKKILIVEDEKNLSRSLSMELEHEGYSVIAAYDGRKGLEEAQNGNFDLILLDLMLPKLDGFEVARRLRNAELRTPIIMMTARDSTMDRVAGLDIGADDYIVKPFAIEELLARLRAHFRREEDLHGGTEPDENHITVRDLTIDKRNRTVRQKSEHTGKETIIDLTKREYELLLTLMQNVNNTVTRKELVENIWGFPESEETNVVDVYVRYLRNKIDQAGEESHIQTVRGLGYTMRDL